MNHQDSLLILEKNLCIDKLGSGPHFILSPFEDFSRYPQFIPKINFGDGVISHGS